MKRLFLLMFALGCLVVAKADNDVQIAVLQSGENVKVFKGPNALTNAHEEAVDGDVITLSEGSFNACNITKSVSIYGAGYEENKTNGTLLTQINSIVTVGLQDKTLSNVHLEGLYLSGGLNVGGGINDYPLANLRVVKSKINYIYSNSTNSNTSFDQCVILGQMNADNNTLLVADLYFRNCIMPQSAFQNYRNTNSHMTIDHCIVGAIYPSGYNPFRNSHPGLLTLTNSIYVRSGNSGSVGFPSDSFVKNCISDQSNVVNYTNCFYVDKALIFKDGENADYSPTRTYELQQPTVWVDDKGNQIGIRGGNGWSKVPSTPVVKNLSVTPSGTNLNVTYEAEVR